MLATAYFIGPFFTGLAYVEQPLRDVEVLHGWEHVRVVSRLREQLYGGVPVYEATGFRAEWTREKVFKSRSERMGKIVYGEGE